jgi:hypothetical protein
MFQNRNSVFNEKKLALSLLQLQARQSFITIEINKRKIELRGFPFFITAPFLGSKNLNKKRLN